MSECEWVWMWMCQNHIDITHWVSWMQFELLISVVWFNSIQFTVSIQLGLVLIFTPNKMCNSLLVSRLFHWHFSLTHSLSMIRLSHEKLVIFVVHCSYSCSCSCSCSCSLLVSWFGAFEGPSKLTIKLSQYTKIQGF